MVVLAIALLGVIGLIVAEPNRERSGPVDFRDGAYTGKAAETPYGTVQIKALIADHKIRDVQFLQMPAGEERSQEITAFAGPALKDNTLKAQSAKIDFVSGATSTSFGYQESLQEALDKAAQN